MRTTILKKNDLILNYVGLYESHHILDYFHTDTPISLSSTSSI